MPSTISLRPPPTTGPRQADFTPPTIDWLSGTWHLTHSTLSMWKSNRNVTMNYSIVPALNAQDPPNKLDDTTSYQPLTSSKFKTINGGDTCVFKDKGGKPGSSGERHRIGSVWAMGILRT
ncbi:hypothetical protein HO173_006396 [Letharia columbiana]|uniref:Uncharacterized protein n=1 Tax=Letharia columbiana TaxID=112416 RepID=A0A8H6L4F2_9LECA|nr:uncharacterized protein HO173_006396 [Letharia columbiana]KAF6235202.1 hypothetical protein HO173_006396 [Letharia columbiana]